MMIISIHLVGSSLLIMATQVSGFVPHYRRNKVSTISRLPCHQQLTCRPMKQRRAVMMFSGKEYDNNIGGNFQDAASRRKILNAQRVMGVLSAVAWIFVSITALSYHPDPKFADCTLRHNILTMSQAFAFPLPVGYATISALSFPDPNVTRRINLAVFTSSMWLASSVAFASKFAFGYDLYTMKLKIFASVVHTTTGLLALFAWRESFNTNQMTISSCFSRIIRGIIGSLWSIGPSTPSSNPDSTSLSSNNNASSWGLCTAGLLWFSVLPVISPYPLATVPTILGKRLSRPASAFTFLSAVCAFCLKENAKSGDEEGSSKHTSRIRKGLFVGSSLHLLLLILKLIGVDGGGLILPGRGLWEVYPAMLAVPFATSSSMALHALVCLAALS